MDDPDARALFWAAVIAWEEYDFMAYRAHRTQLLNMKADARAGRTALDCYNLLIRYVCYSDKVIPFAAFAMAVACRALKGLDAVAIPAQPKLTVINNLHRLVIALLNRGEVDAAFESLRKLEGFREAYRDLDDDLYRAADAAHADLLECLRRASQSVSAPFQDSRLAPSPVPALEGLFTTLCRNLDPLSRVRNDRPGDHVVRSKADFVDALLDELERRNYRSPAFDRLITLRDAVVRGNGTYPR